MQYAKATLAGMTLAALVAAPLWAEDARPDAPAAKPTADATNKPAGQVKTDGTTAAQVDRLIAELDSDSFRAREAATRELMHVGRAAVGPIVAAARSGGPEVAWRSVVVLKGIWISDDADTAAAAQAALEQLVESDRTTVATEAARVLRFGAVDQLARMGLAVEGPPESITSVQVGAGYEGGDAGLRFLRYLTNLQHVTIESTGLSDKGLAHVAKIKQLARLDVYGDAFTPEGVAAVQRQHPNLLLYWFGGAILGIGGREHPDGCLVVSVQPDLGADRAGVKIGDVITKLNGKPIDSFAALTRGLARHKVDEKVKLEISRNGETLTPEVTLSSRAKLGQFVPRGIPQPVPGFAPPPVIPVLPRR